MDPYSFMLDYFPLIEEITLQNAVLGCQLQAIAIEYLLEGKNPRDQIILLLRLSADLGYTSSEVVAFLLDSLNG